MKIFIHAALIFGGALFWIAALPLIQKKVSEVYGSQPGHSTAIQDPKTFKPVATLRGMGVDTGTFPANSFYSRPQLFTNGVESIQ